MGNLFENYKNEQRRFINGLYIKYHKIIAKEIKENYDKFPKETLLNIYTHKEKEYAKLPIPFPIGLGRIFG